MWADLGRDLPAVGLNIAAIVIAVAVLAILVVRPAINSVFKAASENRIAEGVVRYRFMFFLVEIRWGSGSQESDTHSPDEEEGDPSCHHKKAAHHFKILRR
jgi:hypothetical protein